MKKIKWHWDHIEWGPYQYKDTVEYQYYFWFWPNWLEKQYRYFGLQKMWYDGAHASFGFWFFNISWSTQWTTYKHD